MSEHQISNRDIRDHSSILSQEESA